ncbi:hypothetical protein [Saccharopolyspora phatthalungensis]|uniref:Uncharacterized protein n=1 Tax=Saccharopolyspora phatthalungensis TaxID=664693 RepID=A0A840QFZ5_9PSEU|nr:hypothetical protein [Saccharopolyspora phatthalungensis]MBB5159764.1 hypothetical protein [Saccharopolyspora phatthalungensis]
MTEITDVAQVANTQAALLGIDSEIASMLGISKGLQRFLYLPDDCWLDTVRVLIGLAERVIVWAEEKTPAVLRELELIKELGRTEDTNVLLENPPAGAVKLRACCGETPPPAEALTLDDPVLAEFPAVVRAEDVTSVDPDTFLREVMGPIVATNQLPMHERVARIRRRLDATRGT